MSHTSPEVLHPTFFTGPVSLDAMQGYLCRDTYADPSSQEGQGVSVVIQSLNDTPTAMGKLMSDLRRQDTAAEVQTIILDAGNEAKTLEIARNCGAEVVHVPVDKGFRANILNKGLEVADFDTVVTLVGHSALTTSRFLSAAVAAVTTEGGDAAYGVVLPGEVSSRTERLGARVLGAGKLLETDNVKTAGGMGLLAADCSVVRKGAVEAVGGYARGFGSGGADGDLGQRLQRAGYEVSHRRLLSVHHTHGFGPMQAWTQLRAWQRMADRRPYRPQEWLWHPNGGL